LPNSIHLTNSIHLNRLTVTCTTAGNSQQSFKICYEL
jgi:hypothetical protein